jgi:hypothetical protein
MGKVIQLRIPPDDLPRIKDSPRPFRLWDSEAKKSVRWRCYTHELNAHNSALAICRWEQMGRTLEVIDIRTGRWLATYKRGFNAIEITALKKENQ